jgi:hypothetical protein
MRRSSSGLRRIKTSRASLREMAPLHLGLVELSSFMPRECDDAKPLSDLSVLVANEDSGPNTPVDQKTIACKLRAREMLGRDFPQAVMRVLLAGASEAGFHGAMLATGLEVSLARCPWSGAVWWQAIVNGAKEFF